MQLFYLFSYLAILFAMSNSVTSIIIVNELRKRDVKINYFLLRFLIPKYAHQYKKITLEETGEVGRVYYCWLTTINLVLVSFAVAILFRFLFY